jgi:hypothetical protein
MVVYVPLIIYPELTFSASANVRSFINHARMAGGAGR